MDKIVVILGSFVGVDILSLSENSRYEFHPPSDDDGWKGGQAQDPTPPFLSLAVGEHLFDPLGWVIGSDGDPDKCDLQISETNQTGISRRQLRLDIDPDTHCPRITVLSTKSIQVLPDGADARRCSPPEPMVLLAPATLDLGAVTFRAWTPSRTYDQTIAYEKWAGEFSSGLLGAVPRYIPSIQSYPETGEYAVRYGRDGAVYVDESRRESKGASASVMMVRDSRTGKVFGAKVPHFNIHDSHDMARKRWEDLGKEYKYILELDHPYIVKAYDLVAAEDLALPPWMILEYIPLNLSQALGELGQDDRSKAMTHISSALDYLHSRGITHRDVKPDNVLVVYDAGRREQTVYKLADFGTSKHNASEMMETFTGTSRYMAPELFKMPLRYTNKVDMWSLGLVGMRLFSSWNPQSDREWNPRDFGHWVRNLILPLMEKGVPEPLRPLLKGLLLKTPHNRWCASDCTLFLWELSCTEGADSVGESAVRSRKRPASALSNGSSEGEEGQASTVDGSAETSHASRHLRSGGPSLSTARAQQAASPELGSAAPTPHPDDGNSGDGDGEDQGGRFGGGGVTFEEDWREREVGEDEE